MGPNLSVSAAAPRHLLHREATLEVRHLVEFMGGELIRLDQRSEKGLVLIVREGAFR